MSCFITAIKQESEFSLMMFSWSYLIKDSFEGEKLAETQTPF